MALHCTGHQSPVEFQTSPVHNVYIYDIDVGLSNFISKFADNAKIGNSIIDDCDKLSLHEDLRKFSELCESWEMSFMSTTASFYKWVQETKNMIMR